jgi:subtilisin family serine protease
MKETGVSKIDGTQPNAPYSYTGKGVTVCVIDMGFDFQHPAFKDAEGRSRIKCVYMIGNEDGRKFSVEDDEAHLVVINGTFDFAKMMQEGMKVKTEVNDTKVEINNCTKSIER